MMERKELRRKWNYTEIDLMGQGKWTSAKFRVVVLLGYDAL
jgi:hypothetical protein